MVKIQQGTCVRCVRTLGASCARSSQSMRLPSLPGLVTAAKAFGAAAAFQALSYALAGVSPSSVVIAAIVLLSLAFLFPLRPRFRKEEALKPLVDVEGAEEAPCKLRQHEEALDRRPRPLLPERLRLTRSARKLAASWAAVLMTTGLEVEVEGLGHCTAWLKPPQLWLGEEVLDITQQALQLQGSVLSLHGQGVVRIQLEDPRTALELAFTLKA
ncbi:unnamed protein product, partial [Effrenium voratum]